MGDELHDLLKRAKVPGRSPGYWERFPKRVSAMLSGETASPRLRSVWLWVAVAACLVAVMWLPHRLTRQEPIASLDGYRKVYREMSALFPRQVQAIVMDDYGIRLQLADTQQMPDSPPVLVRIHHAAGCRDFITFSGQQIEMDTQKLDVLTDGRNNVLLVGPHLCWSSAEPSGVRGWRIEARTL